jgi:hypothetical protein
LKWAMSLERETSWSAESARAGGEVAEGSGWARGSEKGERAVGSSRVDSNEGILGKCEAEGGGAVEREKERERDALPDNLALSARFALLCPSVASRQRRLVTVLLLPAFFSSSMSSTASSGHSSRSNTPLQDDTAADRLAQLEALLQASLGYGPAGDNEAPAQEADKVVDERPSKKRKTDQETVPALEKEEAVGLFCFP